MPTDTAPPAKFRLPDDTNHPQPNRVFAFLSGIFRLNPGPLAEAINRPRQLGHQFRDYSRDLDGTDYQTGRTFRDLYAEAFDVPADLFDAPLDDVVDHLRTQHADWFQTDLGDPTQWGPNLNALLGASGLTDEDVAAQLRPTADDVRRWREGRQPIPPNRLRDIAAAMRVPARVFGLDRRNALREALDSDLFNDLDQAA